MGKLEVTAEEIGYPEQESWLSKWDDVTRDYEAAEETLTTEGTDNRVIRHRLLRFFEDCWHLAEWIKNDTEVPAAVAQKVVKEAWAAEPMKLCEAVANTSKHHTRRADKATARVMAVKFPQGSGTWAPTVTIKIWQPGIAEPQEHDGRTLAAECMAWWRGFIKQNGLPVPWDEN
ncbi:hypothetical protein ACRB8A_20120 (plasmid) [Arthrobacter sp. G.S.26]|uniref:hypothetical protein n=1 Tax=Arthrobacter sp. G.S.26 TaxID=3433706 RepID=UPI003D786345